MTSVNPLAFESVIQPEPFNELIKRIDRKDVDSVFFSNDMKKIYSRKDVNENGEYDLEDYTITNSDSSVSDIVIDHATKNDIRTVILEKPVNPISIFVEGAYNVFSFLLVPFIILSIIRTFSMTSNMGAGPLGPMGGGNNKLSAFGNMNSDDKNNMIKANISLSSWAGSPEIFQECTEVVTYLNNRTMYQEVGAQIPRGILLEGPPGTGKTLIAKAIASECDANFISIASSEFVELFVGMGAAKVRNLFRQARENAPCIVFIDEIDAVGKQRGTGINAGNDEREQTLNQILAEMDGFAQNDNVLVIGATNRKDVLDNALLRPGRFDRIINVPLPDKSSRVSILNVHMQNKTFEDNVDLDVFAELTTGYSGAELKNLVNEAAIYAVRQGKTIISAKNMKDALEKLTVGIIKLNDTRTEDAMLRVSRHEIGHAFLAACYPEYFKVKKVSIQSTYNGAGGYTLFGELPEIAESGLYTKDLLFKRIVVSLGGKAAETVFYGDNYVSLGAQNDLKQANSLAKQMVGTYGMGDSLKTFYNENTDNARSPFLGRSLATNDGVYSESLKKTFDEEVRKIVDDAYSEALRLVHQNKHKMNVLSNILVNSITLDGKFLMTYRENSNDASYETSSVAPCNDEE
jgi:cell division protease FtsH